MSKQKFDYSFFYLLGLEDQFSPTEDVDSLPFESPRCGRKRLFSEVSITVTSNHLDVASYINSVRKSLVASCVCVWLKFERVFSMH